MTPEQREAVAELEAAVNKCSEVGLHARASYTLSWDHGASVDITINKEKAE